MFRCNKEFQLVERSSSTGLPHSFKFNNGLLQSFFCYLLVVYLVTMWVTHYAASNGEMVLNNGLKLMWKEAVVT
jgi:hypothetical protein